MNHASVCPPRPPPPPSSSAVIAATKPAPRARCISKMGPVRVRLDPFCSQAAHSGQSSNAPPRVIRLVLSPARWHLKWRRGLLFSGERPAPPPPSPPGECGVGSAMRGQNRRDLSSLAFSHTPTAGRLTPVPTGPRASGSACCPAFSLSVWPLPSSSSFPVGVFASVVARAGCRQEVGRLNVPQRFHPTISTGSQPVACYVDVDSWIKGEA